MQKKLQELNLDNPPFLNGWQAVLRGDVFVRTRCTGQKLQLTCNYDPAGFVLENSKLIGEATVKQDRIAKI